MDTNMKLNIINLYENTNLSLIEIAHSIGYNSKDIIYKVLKENHIPKRRSIKNIIQAEEEKNIIALYKNGKSSNDISKLYHTNCNVILNILHKNNILVKTTNKIHTLNEKYFNIIDNQNKAYMLGFIFADGNIRRNGNVLSITVNKKDNDILVKFKKEIETDVDIKEIKRDSCNRIDICNKYICNALIKLGCHPNKTFDLNFPNIKKEFIPHFIRGFMDGDGCISISRRKNKKYFSLSFVGTKDMISNIKLTLDVDNKITSHNHAYEIHIGKKEDVVRCLEYIYNNANLYLDRKRIYYNEIKEYLE